LPNAGIEDLNVIISQSPDKTLFFV